MTHPLNQLLENGVAWKWSDQCQEAWDAVVTAIVESKGIYARDYSQPLYVRTDACAQGLGAYLCQIVGDSTVRVKTEQQKGDSTVMVKTERVIEYWSKSVPKAFRQYDTRKLELLAVILALEHFKPVIDGVTVKLDTDHRNLTFWRT